MKMCVQQADSDCWKVGESESEGWGTDECTEGTQVRQVLSLD